MKSVVGFCLLVLGFVLVLATGPAAAEAAPVRIASKNFNESYILAEVIAQRLKDEEGGESAEAEDAEDDDVEAEGAAAEAEESSEPKAKAKPKKKAAKAEDADASADEADDASEDSED